MTTTRQPEPVLIRTDLEYHLHGQVGLYMTEPFTVDGITYHDPRYQDRRGSGVGAVRPMISIYPDDGDGSGTRMRCNHPPTEAELTHWTRTGLHPGHPDQRNGERTTP